MNKKSNKVKIKKKVYGRISINSELCSGCSICELACSLYHEGICDPSLSRIKIEKKFLLLEYHPIVCSQCDWPSCYFECPISAIEVDSKTGARYINSHKCIGCGKCEKVCPMVPSDKVLIKKKIGKKKVYIKCDLCKGRKGGPLCVEMCPRNAISFYKTDRKG